MTTTKGIKTHEQQYADLMVEARLRLKTIETLLNHNTMPAIAVRDFGYIQLRMLCELIALTCLVAHGDIAETKTKRLREEWKAGKIIEALNKMHPNFFPLGCIQQLLAPGRFHYTVLSPDLSLSKDELKKLHGLCGDRLHRGDMSDLWNISPNSLKRDLDEITTWAKKINNLLSVHMISLIDGDTKFICTLRTNPHGRVSFSRAVKLAQGESEPTPDHPIK